MPQSSDAAEILAAVTALATEYWYNVDFHWGRGASDFYTEDGVFAIGESRMSGRQAIIDFYKWREQRGDRTARHVITNFRLECSDEDHPKLRCILLLYAADGAPILESLPAILIADVLADFVRGSDGRYLFTSHMLHPVFMGGVSPTIPPATG